MHSIPSQPAGTAKQEPAGARRLGLILALVVILAGMAYLVAIPFGLVGPNRLQLAEAIIFSAMLIFAIIMASGLEKISVSTSGVELVRRVEAQQVRQQREIETLRFLVSYFVTDSELNHLRLLERRGSAPYSVSEGWELGILQDELRRLRSLGLIKMVSRKEINQMPPTGDLSAFCLITERGERYLALRHQAEGFGALPAGS